MSVAQPTRLSRDASWSEPAGVAVRGLVAVLPGRGESATVYERFGRRLSADAYRVHVLAGPSVDPERAAEHLTAVFSSAPAEIPRVVVGSDAGAAFAAFLAADGAAEAVIDVAGLVLAGLPTTPAATAPRDWSDELDLRTACSAHRTRITADGVVPTELFDGLPAEWVDPALPGRIQVPVLGLHGLNDALSPFDAAQQWYAAVPRAELVGVRGGRHDVLNDQTHRSVAATVVLFLERLRLGPDLPSIVGPVPPATVGPRT